MAGLNAQYLYIYREIILFGEQVTLSLFPVVFLNYD